MSIEIKEDLKERVLAFIATEHDYDPDNVDEVTVTNETQKLWSILYGENIDTGIRGFGTSPDVALDDFVIKWRSHKGFQWIRRKKMLIDNKKNIYNQIKNYGD